jgi:hypothetical protein
VRGFVAVSLAEIGGSALTNSRRPLSSVTLAIWELAGCAHTASVARTIHPAIAVRLLILCLGEGKLNLLIASALDASGSMRLQYYRASWEVTSQGKKLCPARHPSDANLIITKALAGLGDSARPFLGQLCPFRQPRLNRVCRPRNPLPAWPKPVSACQHGL